MSQRPRSLIRPPGIGLPQLAEPAVDADYIYASMGRCERPIDDRDKSVIMTGFGDKRGQALDLDCISENDDAGVTATMTEASIASMARLGPRKRGLSQAVKPLPGERMGWWSSQKYDKRKRMRALVQGAVDDARTRILLDTGANVSVVSAALAKRLRLRDIPDHGRSLEVSELDPTEDNPSTAESNTIETLYSSYVCALVGGEPDTVDADTTETAEHTAIVGGLDDYAHELAFLPDLSEVSVSDLNYTGDNAG
ncbi:unnamed protein product [Phytophthora lilii]|uniref:Unnamed protein product n=1 Tax=Phytophthora lilii TaxID=2077276 RepID=A0A9W6X620_9STRA|nr:unnamed protein product [Phytophthora lilii]